MLNTLRSIFKNKELRKKFLLTIFILIGIRMGNQIPTYGVNTDYFKAIFENNAAFGFINSMTGDSFSRLSIFALSITPYITASIIMQLLMVAIPAIEEMAKDGVTGKDKFEKITYIVAGVLGFIEAAGMSIGFGNQGLLKSYTWYNCLIVTVLWGSFALLTILLGKIIDKKGIGNGISLILLCNILSSLPTDATVLYEKFCLNKRIATQVLNIFIMVIITLAIFTFSLILNDSEKVIAIHSSSRVAGRKNMSSGSGKLPIKVCLVGVMPVIFASSIMSIPVIIGGFINNQPTGVWGFIYRSLNSGNWFDVHNFQYTVGYLLYVLLVIFFGYFYASISFNTYEISENLKKQGSTIKGIRPGKPTTEYLNNQVKYIIFIGTIGLLIIATIPMLISGFCNIGSLSFGGTSIMIITSVILETKKKLETETITSRKSLSFIK